MTITEFLIARIAEDEANAASWYEDWGGNMETLRDRVLAECKAKRAIIEQADEATGLDMSVDGEFRVGRRDEAKEPYCGDVILRALASVYADHPDFDPAWA